MTVEFETEGCHPGYVYDENTDTCTCDTGDVNIVRCDENKRYLYFLVRRLHSMCVHAVIVIRIHSTYSIVISLFFSCFIIIVNGPYRRAYGEGCGRKMDSEPW